MKKVLLIATLDNENDLRFFIPELKKNLFFDDIILCNNGNRSHMAFVNEQLNLEYINIEDTDYGKALNEGIKLIQKRYSNENALIIFLSKVDLQYIEDFKKIINLIENEGYDLVYKVESCKVHKVSSNFLKKIINKFVKGNFEDSYIQGVKMRKLLNLNYLEFDKNKWKSDMIMKAKKAGMFIQNYNYNK